MREKALTLALLMIVSALAGCVTEDRERNDSDSSDSEISLPVEYPDTDVDGLSDKEEEEHGTDPLLWDTDRDGVSDGWEIYHGYDPLNGSDGAPRALCEWNEADWIEASDRGVEAYCHYSDEWYQELCEQRNGTWIESSDRSRESYCDLDDNRDDDREITQEDCERRNGTWIANPDRPVDGYCDFGEDDREDDREELLIHQMFIVYPDNSSELMLCRGCIGIENLTVWNLTTTALTERNISMNYSTHEVGHNVSGINGSDSPSDGSWHWTLYVWNETDAANASWEESRYGGEYTGIHVGKGTGHIAWAPNTTNISDIPVPRIFVENTDGDSEMTQEDCERRGGTWTEATDRDGVHYCDFEEEEREDDREESNDDSDPQADCEERGGTWVEETSECSQES